MSKAERLIEKLEDAGFEPRAYSGRSMYGKECVAVSGRISEYEVGQAVGKGFGKPLTDSMGLGIVVYWPNHEWPAEPAASTGRE